MKIETKHIKKVAAENYSWGEVILHASFELLEDFIEHGGISCLSEEVNSDFIKEVTLLNEWWQSYKSSKWSIKKEMHADQMFKRLAEIRNGLWF